MTTINRFVEDNMGLDHKALLITIVIVPRVAVSVHIVPAAVRESPKRAEKHAQEEQS